MSKRRRKRRIWPLFTLVLLSAVLTLLYLQRSKNIPVYHLEQPPHPFISHGIDVSHHQGDIDWTTFIEALDTIHPFVYCKATEGIEHVDTKFKKNRQELLELGVRHGAYHFFQPDMDPIAQAEHFLSHYNFQQDDLPPALDYEIERENKEEQLINILAWLKYVESKTGKRPIIYTSYNLYWKWLNNVLPDHQFWVANYSNKSYRFQQENIIHWQYSEKGSLQGIEGYVDLNYSKIKF